VNPTQRTLTGDILNELQKNFSGDLRIDKSTRILYSTDASIYQIEPLGVAFPRTDEDLVSVIETCARNKIPVLARGAGSSLAGQAIGAALIIDCSRHLTKIIQINPDENTAEVEPGVILSDLNRAAAKFGLRFGPDPASADRATIGGSLANNATGAHSILYGMSSDHLLAADVLLSDGSQVRLESLPIERAMRVAGVAAGSNVRSGRSIESDLYRSVFDIRENYSEEIKNRWPRTWRCASGYNLPYLLPWAPSRPPQWVFDDPYPPALNGNINLAPLFAGSEGTLGVFQRLKLRMVQTPAMSILVLLPYRSLEEACESVPGLLEYGPSAIELIPQSLVALAKSIPSYASQLSFVDQLKVNGKQPEAFLAVEFFGDEKRQLEQKAALLGKNGLIAETSDMQKKVWEVRNVGLGILNSIPGDNKAISLIEDLSVPVERLAEFVRELRRILGEHGQTVQLYAHASAGCLHGRFLMNLKTEEGMRDMRSIASEAVALTLSLGGAVSGEHGDGLARGEWLEQAFGSELVKAFKMLKRSADPENILNPGKIVDVPRMDSNLRFGSGYWTKAWTPVMDFSANGGYPGEKGLVGAVEHCNGAGVCRKSGGTMCPSFQALQDEKHSTRGRANLLRAMMSGRFPSEEAGEQAVKEALDLCLACKGCRAECPSGVDLAKLKFEFLNQYYTKRGRPISDYLFGYIDRFLSIGAPFAPLLNKVMASSFFWKTGARLLGLSPQRKMPLYALQPLGSILRALPEPAMDAEPVLVLLDSFNRYFYPENCYAALRLLIEAGCRPILLPVNGAGRTLISKGLLGAARSHARNVISAVQRCDPKGILPVLGIEPSEIYTLRDEYPDLLGGAYKDDVLSGLGDRTFLVDEYLVRPGPDGKKRIFRVATIIHYLSQKNHKEDILLHTHCYQKAQAPAKDGFAIGSGATIEMLEAAGYRVSLIDAGCCGMAGSFGYEANHYELSMKVGEGRLFPALREAGLDVIVAAGGVSCHTQIEDGTGRTPIHPLRLLASQK
jgi:FAD/FMN-containing dehydrogenase/Fe-S oxidoreductase